MNENDTVWALKGTSDSDRWEEYQGVAGFVSTLQRDEGSTDWFDDETLTAVIWYDNDLPAVNIAVCFYGEGHSHIPCCHLYLEHDVDIDDPTSFHVHEGGDALSLLTKLRWGNDRPDDWFGRRYMQSYLDKLYRMVRDGKAAHNG